MIRRKKKRHPAIAAFLVVVLMLSLAAWAGREHLERRWLYPWPFEETVFVSIVFQSKFSAISNPFGSTVVVEAGNFTQDEITNVVAANNTNTLLIFHHP